MRFELLLRLTDRKEICKAISEICGKNGEETYDTYISICNRNIKRGNKLTNTYLMTESFKNLLSRI